VLNFDFYLLRRNMLDNWSIATKSFIQIYIKYVCSHINYTSIYFVIGSTSHIEEIDLKSEIVHHELHS